MAYTFGHRLRISALAALLLPVGATPAHATHTPPLDSLRALLYQPGLADSTRLRYEVVLADQLTETDSSQHYAQAAIALARRLGNRLGEAKAQLSLAKSCYDQADYPATQRAYERAVQTARRANSPRLLGDSYLGMGNLAYLLRDMAGSLAYYRQATAAYASCAPPYVTGQLIVLSNTTGHYFNEGQTAEGERTLRQAIALLRPDTKPKQRAKLLNLLGGLQARHHQPDSARATWEAVVRLTHASDLPQVEAETLGHLADLCLTQEQPAAAQAYIQQAIRLNRRMGRIRPMMEDLYSLARILRAQRRVEAFDSLDRYLTLRDSLLFKERAEETTDAQARFDAAGKQAQIVKLEQQRRIQRLEADQQAVRTRFITASAVALALMLFGAAVLYLRLRRTSAALTVSEAQARAAEAEARRAVATKDQLMSIIGHDLRSPVATFQQVTPLLHHFADEPNPAAQHEIATALDTNAHHLGALLDNLLYWARAEAETLMNHPQALPVAAVLTEAAAPYTAGAHLKGVGLTTAVANPDGTGTDDPTEPLLVTADPDLLRTVLRNLVSNAVKFTPKGGQIQLRAWVEAPGHVTLEVRDTGVGIAPSRVAGLFSTGETLSTVGTAGEPGTGLGLPLSARFVRLLGSELRLVPPAAGQPGTAFRFELPLAVALAYA